MQTFSISQSLLSKVVIFLGLALSSGVSAQPWRQGTREFKAASDRAILKTHLENYYKGGMRSANQALDPFNYTSLWVGKLRKPLQKIESLVAGQPGSGNSFSVDDLESQEQGIRDLMRRANVNMDAHAQVDFFTDLGQQLEQIEKSAAVLPASEEFMESVARLRSEARVSRELLELTEDIPAEEVARQFDDPESPLARKFVEIHGELQQIITEEFGALKLRLDREARIAEAQAEGREEEVRRINEEEASAREKSRQAHEAAQSRMLAAKEASQFFSTLVSQSNPELGRKVYLTTQAAIKIISAVETMNRSTTAATSVALGGYLGMANAGFMLVQAFGPSQKTGEQIILEQLHALSLQINDLRNEMHERFNGIESMIGELHQDMWKSYLALNAALETNLKIGVETKNLVQKIERKLNVLAGSFSQDFLDSANMDLAFRQDECLLHQRAYLRDQNPEDRAELENCLYRLGRHLDLISSMRVFAGVEVEGQTWWDYVETLSYVSDPEFQINALRTYSYQILELTPPSTRVPNLRDFALNTSFLADFSNSLPEFARELSGEAGDRSKPDGNENGLINPYSLTRKFHREIYDWQEFLQRPELGADEPYQRSAIRSLFNLDNPQPIKPPSSDHQGWTEALYADLLSRRSEAPPFYLYNNMNRATLEDAPIVLRKVVGTMRAALEALWTTVSLTALQVIKNKESDRILSLVKSKNAYVNQRQEAFGEEARDVELLGETREAVEADTKLMEGFKSNVKNWSLIDLYLSAARTTVHLTPGNKSTKEKVGAGFSLPLHFDELVELFGDLEALEEIFVAASMQPEALEAFFNITVLEEAANYRHLTGLKIVLKLDGRKFLAANFSSMNADNAKYRRSCVINRGNITRGYDNIALMWEREMQFKHKPFACRLRAWVKESAAQFIDRNPQALEGARRAAAQIIRKHDTRLMSEYGEELKKIADVSDADKDEQGNEELSRIYFAGFRMLQLLSQFTFPSSSLINYEMRRLLSGPQGYVVNQTNMDAKNWADFIVEETVDDSILWDELHGNGLEGLLHNLDSLEILLANIALDEKERLQTRGREPVERFVGLDYQINRLDGILVK